MEKRNTLLLTVIAIATLLVAVIGATFAYMANDIEVINNKNDEVNESGSATFFANGSKLNIGVKSEDIVDFAEGIPYAESNSELTVTYNAAGTRESSCTYDVYFRWTSENKYFEHSKYLLDNNYIDNTGNEFTISVSGSVNNSTGKGLTTINYINLFNQSENNEADYSLLDGCDTVNGCKIGSGVVYSNTNETNKATSVTWNFKNTIYNIGNQNDPTYGIIDKEYSGEYYITNVVC